MHRWRSCLTCSKFYARSGTMTLAGNLCLPSYSNEYSSRALPFALGSLWDRRLAWGRQSSTPRFPEGTHNDRQRWIHAGSQAIRIECFRKRQTTGLHLVDFGSVLRERHLPVAAIRTLNQPAAFTLGPATEVNQTALDTLRPMSDPCGCKGKSGVDCSGRSVRLRRRGRRVELEPMATPRV